MKGGSTCYKGEANDNDLEFLAHSSHVETAVRFGRFLYCFQLSRESKNVKEKERGWKYVSRREIPGPGPESRDMAGKSACFQVSSERARGLGRVEGYWKGWICIRT